MSFVADIASGASLKAVETVDKSAPVIEKDVKIGENPFKKVASDLVQPHELKPAETVDKSASVINKAVRVRTSTCSSACTRYRTHLAFHLLSPLLRGTRQDRTPA